MEKTKEKIERIRHADVATLRDNYQQAAQRKEKLYLLLDMLETEELSCEEHERVCEKAQRLIDELKNKVGHKKQA